LKSALFLQLIPLLLEDVHCLRHLDFGKKVPYEVINDDISLDRARENS